MKQGTILLVEDSIDDIDLALLAFKNANIRNPLLVAEDGAAALDHLFGHDAKPSALQLVILDLKLPKVSGLDVLRRIRAQEQTRFLPVVVLSTSKEDADVKSSYALGANAYVRKPVAFEDFLTAMSRLGLFWMETNVTAPAGDWPALPRH